MTFVNLVNVNCTDKAELFNRLRDYVGKRNGTYDYSTTGIGWTLIDESYAVDEDNPQVNDWVVFYSTGESGTEDLYVQIKWLNNGINLNLWLYWNTTTSVGVSSCNTSSNFTVNESGSFQLSVHGDLNFFMGIETSNSATNNYIGFVGKVNNLMYDNTLAVCSTALSAGSDISIVLDAVPAAWEVDMTVYLVDPAHRQRITIKTIVGNTITADVTYSTLSGAKIRGDFGYGTKNSASANSFYFLMGRISDTSGIGVYSVSPALAANSNPDLLNDVWVGCTVTFLETSGYYGSLPYILTVPTGGTDGTVHIDTATGYSYRYYKFYSNVYLMIREV